MTEELKPCPFCGGEAYLHEFKSYVMPQSFWVMCNQCGIGTKEFIGFNGKTKAIKTWNKRQEMTATWEPTDEEYQWKCSNCYETFDYDYPSSIYSSLLYCPNCGARMRKQKQEE